MNNPEFQSLFDYLGKPAGSELGKKVFEDAKYKKIPIQTKVIQNPKYNGNVMMYPKSYLTEYFNLVKNATINSL